MPEKIVLVDGYSLMYRAFHALPLMDNGEGEYTNAVYGFMAMLLKVLGEERPEYLAVAFDEHGKTFRHERFEEYKAGRAPTPDELRPQIPRIREMLALMGVPQLSLPGYEADDLLGTISRECEEMGVDSLIVTGDRDAYQLAGAHTEILYTKRGISDTERVTPEWINEKYGVTPDKMIDIKGLMGDASDNIPGVPGIGEKTAIKLITKYGSVEEALARAQTEEKGALRERLVNNAQQALVSKWLGTIDRRAPLKFNIEKCRLGDLKGALPLMRKLKLKSLIPRVEGASADAEGAPSAIAFEPVEALSGADELRARVSEILASRPKRAAIYIGEKVSVAFSSGERLACELGGTLLDAGMSDEDAANALKELCADERVCVIMHNVKAFPGDIAPLRGHSQDAMLAAYVINAQLGAYGLKDILSDAGVALDDMCPAGALMTLFDAQLKRLGEDGLTSLYADVEMPLMFVLRDMERAGFMVDAEYLRRLGGVYSARLEQLTMQIYSLAGERVNINSPKQLGELLFEKLRIPAPQKKKGGWSTAADVLEELAGDYPICAAILEYRKYQKLNSTYVDALLRLRSPDGRIHTVFEQTATGTGRISSREPNLQNIPVRTELGREIRRAFVAAPGCVLVDADYSQIELRVLAHMAGDERMLSAFRNDEDIHARTAAEVYGVALDGVTGDMRSAAKAVNFGIVYGISDFGLAKNIGVSRQQAADFIERYMHRYPDIKRYMDSQVALGKTQGYVSTLLGRRRYLKEMESAVYNMRAFGERAAMNSPIQGTAADIIKLAMVRVHEALRREGLRAKLILQVHDELIVEAPISEQARVEALLKSGMESVLALSAPLKTELSTGGNWNDCKS